MIVFIGGSPRSGTTLVQKSMDSHPEIFAPGEFNYMPKIIELYEDIQEAIEKNKSMGYYFEKGRDKKVMNNLLNDIFKGAAKEKGYKIVSEKTPSNVLYFEELKEICPESKFIFVIRHPLAVVASLKKVRYKYKKKYNSLPLDYTRNLALSIDFAKRCIQKGLKFCEEHSNVLTVKYENFVTNPTEETKRICCFLNIEWSENMLYPKDNASSTKDGRETKGIWYDEKMFFRNIDRESMNKWKTTLTPTEITLVSEAFKTNNLLNKYGYVFPKQSKRNLIEVLRYRVQRFLIDTRQRLFSNKRILKISSLVYYNSYSIQRRNHEK